jgi:hypothetical protein
MWLAVAGITLLAAIGFGVLALAVQSKRQGSRVVRDSRRPRIVK